MNKKEIYNKLASLPNIHVVNSIQLVTRCVLCGDSAKDPNKKRLGIKCDWNDPTAPIMFNCFNCGQHGVLTTHMIEDIGLYDKEVNESVRLLNKRALEDDGHERVNKYKNLHEIKVKIPPLTTKQTSLKKVKYVFDRIGYMIDPTEFEKLKIIWSLDDFLKLNNIKPVNKYTDLLERDYVGFLSVRNEYIIFRDITENNKMRYVKYNVFGVLDNTNSFYTIKNQVDLLSREPIHIIAAEGTFDVLSILYNIKENEMMNTIYLAVCNGSFKNSLMYFFNKGFVGENIYVDIYKDNDSIINYKKLKSEIKVYTNNFQVYYNAKTHEKDFGVPKDRIKIGF